MPAKLVVARAGKLALLILVIGVTVYVASVNRGPQGLLRLKCPDCGDRSNVTNVSLRVLYSPEESPPKVAGYMVLCPVCGKSTTVLCPNCRQWALFLAAINPEPDQEGDRESGMRCTNCGAQVGEDLAATANKN